MPLTRYGIAHCDTVKRAHAWFVLAWPDGSITVGFDPVAFSHRLCAPCCRAKSVGFDD